MSAAHTEGLLYVDKNADNRVTLRSKDTDYPIVTDLDDDEDARRLAACWNALKDMSTDEIERVSLAGSTASNVVKQAFMEFDQLVAARALLGEAMEKCGWVANGGPALALRIRAFLKGGAA